MSVSGCRHISVHVVYFVMAMATAGAVACPPDTTFCCPFFRSRQLVPSPPPPPLSLSLHLSSCFLRSIPPPSLSLFLSSSVFFFLHSIFSNRKFYQLLPLAQHTQYTHLFSRADFACMICFRRLLLFIRCNSNHHLCTRTAILKTLYTSDFCACVRACVCVCVCVSK